MDKLESARIQGGFPLYSNQIGGDDWKKHIWKLRGELVVLDASVYLGLSYRLQKLPMADLGRKGGIEGLLMSSPLLGGWQVRPGGQAASITARARPQDCPVWTPPPPLPAQSPGCCCPCSWGGACECCCAFCPWTQGDALAPLPPERLVLSLCHQLLFHPD